MIEFDQVSKFLGGKQVLDDLSFTIEGNETFVIVGASGTGKSVTLKHMVRLLTPDEGVVRVDGEAVSHAVGDELARLRMKFGFLFQSAALMQWMSVGDNVGLPLQEHTDMPRSEIEERVREKLRLVNIEDAYDKFPSDLSGGMRKRVGLARAIVMEPQIVLYDEPTSGLDPVTSRTIDRLIDEMRDTLGVTSVVVTHDLHSALAIGTRIGMLAGGRMAEIATPGDFIKSKEKSVQQFLESQYITAEGSWAKEMSS